MQSIDSLALKILPDSSLGPYSNTASSSIMASSTAFEQKRAGQKKATRSFTEKETEEEFEDGDEYEYEYEDEDEDKDEDKDKDKDEDEDEDEGKPDELDEDEYEGDGDEFGVGAYDNPAGNDQYVGAYFEEGEIDVAAAKGDPHNAANMDDDDEFEDDSLDEAWSCPTAPPKLW